MAAERAVACAVIGIGRAAELGTSTRGTCGRVRIGWTRVAFAAGARGFGLGLARRFVIGVAVVTGYAGGAFAVVGLLNKQGGHEDAHTLIRQRIQVLHQQW